MPRMMRFLAPADRRCHQDPGPSPMCLVSFFSCRGPGSVTASLVAVFILFGSGPVFADTFCFHGPGGETVRGFFVTPERKTRLHLYTKPDEGGCRLRHDGGPASEPFPSAGYAEFAGVCRDPVTGRDWALLYRAAGQYADLGFWSVDPVTRAPRLEYEEAWTVWGLEEEQYGEVVAGGECLARKRREVQALLLEAMTALGTGDRGSVDGPDEERFDLQLDESVELPARPVPEEEVHRWLLALGSAQPAIATFEGARYADDASRESWTVIQVLGTRFYEAPGVVLVLDRARNEWRALYEVLSGGSKILNFPMRDMVVSGDRLFGSLCTDCSGWGRYDDFEIDLRTNRATRLAIVPDFGFEEDGNPLIRDVRSELGLGASNP